MELERPVGLSQREICAHFNDGNLAHFDGLPKNKELCSYVDKFEFGRPKVAHILHGILQFALILG